MDFRIKRPMKPVIPLEPIPENQKAHIAHLSKQILIRDKDRNLITSDSNKPLTPMTPDNGINFLNEG